MGLTKEQIKEVIRTKLNYKITNMVATVDLGRKIPLVDLATYLKRNVYRLVGGAIINYNPERFPGLIIKKINLPDKNSISMLIFSSGKVVITGAKKVEHTKYALEILKKILNNYGIKLDREPQLTISNIVLKGDLGVSLNVERLVFDLDRVIYEPEVFPGAIVRLEKEINGENMEFVYLLFNTGKFVCTGVRSPELIKEAIDLLVETIASLLESWGYSEEGEEEEEIDIEI